MDKHLISSFLIELNSILDSIYVELWDPSDLGLSGEVISDKSYTVFKVNLKSVYINKNSQWSASEFFYDIVKALAKKHFNLDYVTFTESGTSFWIKEGSQAPPGPSPILIRTLPPRDSKGRFIKVKKRKRKKK